MKLSPHFLIMVNYDPLLTNSNPPNKRFDCCQVNKLLVAKTSVSPESIFPLFCVTCLDKCKDNCLWFQQVQVRGLGDIEGDNTLKFTKKCFPFEAWWLITLLRLLINLELILISSTVLAEVLDVQFSTYLNKCTISHVPSRLYQHRTGEFVPSTHDLNLAPLLNDLRETHFCLCDRDLELQIVGTVSGDKGSNQCQFEGPIKRQLLPRWKESISIVLRWVSVVLSWENRWITHSCWKYPHLHLVHPQAITMKVFQKVQIWSWLFGVEQCPVHDGPDLHKDLPSFCCPEWLLHKTIPLRMTNSTIQDLQHQSHQQCVEGRERWVDTQRVATRHIGRRSYVRNGSRPIRIFSVTKSMGIPFIYLNPLNKPTPDRLDVTSLNLERHAEVDETDEFHKVLVIFWLWEFPFEEGWPKVHRPERPCLSGHVWALWFKVGNASPKTWWDSITWLHASLTDCFPYTFG